MDHQTAIQEAALAGINSMDRLIHLLSHQNHDCGEDTDLTLPRFNNLISVLNRMGHARFRRAPSNLPIDFADQSQSQFKPFKPPKVESSQLSASQTTSSFLSSVTGDDTVSNGKVFVSSFGKPPLPSSYKKKCRDHVLSSAGRCHCSKTRKSRFKKIVRVPAINSKIAEIPSDEYSWRKYGQKPIIGSPYPRGYYRCSSVRGCPARKHVERSRDNPRTLMITYEGEHRHSHLK